MINNAIIIIITNTYTMPKMDVIWIYSTSRVSTLSFSHVRTYAHAVIYSHSHSHSDTDTDSHSHFATF